MTCVFDEILFWKNSFSAVRQICCLQRRVGFVEVVNRREDILSDNRNNGVFV